VASGVSEKTVFNYFPTKEDLFFDEAPKREAALIEAIRGREPGESILAALRRLQIRDCPRICSPGFAIFARTIEDSPALQAKELEVMARFVQVLSEAIKNELQLDERDANIAAGLLVSVHRQFFRAARKQALAGKHGPSAARRLRADLERAYQLLEHGLGHLEQPSQTRTAATPS
jgi:AcrR family transcriptional regulator